MNDSLSLQCSFNRKSLTETMADIRFPEACEALRSHIIWICRQKRGWGVRDVYLGHRSQSLRGGLLLVRPLLCSLQDVLQRQTTTFRFCDGQTESTERIFSIWGRKVETRCVNLCLPFGQEVVTSVSGADYVGMRTFHTATHRDEPRLLLFISRVVFTKCTVAFCLDTI